VGPVFVGGTGRCGTHVVASIAAHSGRYAQVPAELRLHVSPDGLRGFAEGRHSRRHLLRGLRTHWWRHSPAWDPAQSRGAHRIVSRRRYVTALARLAAEPPGANRLFISRRFVSSLLDPLAPRPGAWIEKSPDNCATAAFLHRLYPESRLIHVIRDGRDVACSFMRVPWAPDDFGVALAYWEQGVLDAHRGTLGVPAERVHRILLEDLVAHDRERGYRDLLAFLRIPNEPDLRAFFDRELTPTRARIGRWRTDVDPGHHPLAESLYRDALERLAAAGVAPLPPLEPAGPSSHPAEVTVLQPPSPIDPWATATA
jgi:hypothetical protein